MKEDDERLLNMLIFKMPLTNKELNDLAPWYAIFIFVFIIVGLLYAKFF